MHSLEEDTPFRLTPPFGLLQRPPCPSRYRPPSLTVIRTVLFPFAPQVLEDDALAFALSFYRTLIFESLAADEGVNTEGFAF